MTACATSRGVMSGVDPDAWVCKDWLNLGVGLDIKFIALSRGNGLSNTRVNRTGKHSIASDALLTEAPCHILGSTNL